MSDLQVNLCYYVVFALIFGNDILNTFTYNYFFILGYKRSSLNVVQYTSRSGDLVWKQDAFRNFPIHGVNNFKKLRQRADFCFFDKIAFIIALESFHDSALFFLRPCRSSKSLGLSTLAHFHGREHLPDYKPLFEVSDTLSFYRPHLFAQSVSLLLIDLLLSL